LVSATLLTAVLAWDVLPVAAATTTTVDVSSAAQLEQIDQNPGSYLTDTIVLTSDINLSGYNWKPFGESTPFSGTFNGQGHTISNVTINDATDRYVGFFGWTSGTIENVGLVNPNVTGSLTNASIGALAGYQSGGIISNCSNITGNVTGTGFQSQTGGLVGQQYGGTISQSQANSVGVTGDYNNGGLVGKQGGGTISNSRAHGTITGSSDTNNGGLVGSLNGTIRQSQSSAVVQGGTGSNNGGLVGAGNGGAIRRSYAWASVSGSTASNNGGLVGFLDAPGGTLSNSYANGYVNGSVSGGGGSDNGGVVGDLVYGTIRDTYATEPVASNGGGGYYGGLVGYLDGTYGTINASYFDTQTTGQSIGVGNNSGATGATGQTTAKMQQQSTYSGWDFTKTWGLSAALNGDFGDFPYLQWQYPSVPSGQMPEVPYAVVLPLILAGSAAWMTIKRRTMIANAQG
jgi:hypothetical protein